jgi:hypothetical protein
VEDYRPFWKKYFWALSFVAVVLLGTMISLVRIPIGFTEADAQAMLDQQLSKFNEAHTGNKLGPVTIRFYQDSLTIEAQGEGSARNQTVSAQVYSVGKPSYRDASVYFLATEFETSNILINNMEPIEALQVLVDDSMTKIERARDRVLGGEKKEGLLGKAAEAAAKFATNNVLDANRESLKLLVVEYEDETHALMESMILNYLQNAPLYTLDKNSEERLAAPVLSDISIKDGQLVVTLTGARFIQTLVSFILALMITVGWLLAAMRGRGFGIGL